MNTRVCHRVDAGMVGGISTGRAPRRRSASRCRVRGHVAARTPPRRPADRSAMRERSPQAGAGQSVVAGGCAWKSPDAVRRRRRTSCATTGRPGCVQDRRCRSAGITAAVVRARRSDAERGRCARSNGTRATLAWRASMRRRRPPPEGRMRHDRTADTTGTQCGRARHVASVCGCARRGRRRRGRSPRRQATRRPARPVQVGSFRPAISWHDYSTPGRGLRATCRGACTKRPVKPGTALRPSGWPSAILLLLPLLLPPFPAPIRACLR